MVEKPPKRVPASKEDIPMQDLNHSSNKDDYQDANVLEDEQEDEQENEQEDEQEDEQEGIEHPALLYEIGKNGIVLNKCEDAILEVKRFEPAANITYIRGDTARTALGVGPGSNLLQKAKDNFIIEMGAKFNKARIIIEKTSGVFYNANLNNATVSDHESYWISSMVNFNHSQIELSMKAVKNIATEVENSVSTGLGKILINELGHYGNGEPISEVVKSLPEIFEGCSKNFDADVNYLIETLNMAAKIDKGGFLKKKFSDLRLKTGGPVFAVGSVGGFSFGVHRNEAIFIFVIEVAGVLFDVVPRILHPRVLSGFKTLYQREDVRRYEDHLHKSSHIKMLGCREPVLQLELCPLPFQTGPENDELKARWEGVLTRFDYPRDQTQDSANFMGMGSLIRSDEVAEAIKEAKERVHKKILLVDSEIDDIGKSNMVINRVLNLFQTVACVANNHLTNFKEGLREQNPKILKEVAINTSRKDINPKVIDAWNDHLGYLKKKVAQSTHDDEKIFYQAIYDFFESEKKLIEERHKRFDEYIASMSRASSELNLAMRCSEHGLMAMDSSFYAVRLAFILMTLLSALNVEWCWIVFWAVSGVGLIPLIVCIVCYTIRWRAVVRLQRIENFGTQFHSP